MPRRASVSFAESVISDLHDIREWYTEQLAPEAGERLIAGVFNQAERLADFPESGRIVPEFNVPHLREIIQPPLRIVYRLDGDRVRIVRVWRSERLLKVEP